MSNDVYSGAAGSVSGGSVYNSIGEWSVTQKNDTQAFIDSSTYGGQGRLKGNDDWSGRYRANGAQPVPLLFPAFAFVGSIDGTNGVSGTAIVDSIRINWDIAGGKIIDHEVSFSGNGVLNKGAAAAAAGAPAVPESSIIAVPVKLATPAVPTAGQSWVALDQIESITLEIKRDNKQYVDSYTAGGVRRKKGPIDWTCSIKLHPNAGNGATALSGLPQPKDIKGIQLFIDDTKKYELNWGMFSDISDITVNVATQEVMSVTLNAAMCGMAVVGGAANKGSIVGPNSEAIW